MKIALKRTPEVIQMFNLMADNDYAKASSARQAFADFIQPALYNVIEADAVLGSFFKLNTYNWGFPSTIPLAPLFDIRQNDLIRVWSQPRAGGLVTSLQMNVDELPVMVHSLNSAVAFKLDYVRAARVDVVAAYLAWLGQEVLTRQELDSAAVLTTTAAQAQYINNAGNTGYQVLRTATQGTVTVQDFNKLATLMSRINRPNIGGTPKGASRSITTMVGSPEFLEVIKNSAFQPQNGTLTTSNTAIPSSDKFRDDIYNAAGNPSWYGTELVVVYDMGQGYAYNVLFGVAAGSNAYTGYGGSGTAVFSPGSEQVVFGIDRRRDFLARLAEIPAGKLDESATLQLVADNQWSNRSEEIGFFAKLREGRISVDGRSVVSLVY